jgi:hypothetical protein
MSWKINALSGYLPAEAGSLRPTKISIKQVTLHFKISRF